MSKLGLECVHASELLMSGDLVQDVMFAVKTFRKNVKNEEDFWVFLCVVYLL